MVGLQWMVSRYNNLINGNLPDETGLGKTMQLWVALVFTWGLSLVAAIAACCSATCVGILGGKSLHVARELQMQQALLRLCSEGALLCDVFA